MYSKTWLLYGALFNIFTAKRRTEIKPRGFKIKVKCSNVDFGDNITLQGLMQ